MIERIVKNPIALTAVIFICALFTYGGAVNLGWSGYAMATPFIILWMFVSFRAGRNVLFVSLLIFLTIAYFYYLRTTGHPVFYPANGKMIVLNQDACFNIYKNEYDEPYENFILARELTTQEDCLNSNKSIPAIIKSRTVPKGTEYQISRTDVSHADMGEQYHAVVDDSDGKLIIYDPQMFSYTDGHTLTTESLRNPYFYYPSLLMYGPILPLTVLSLFSPRA